MRLSCQTTSNAFTMSRNTPRTSYPSSNDAYISWVIDKSWLMQEPPGLKPDWFVEIRWFVMRKLNISLYNIHSNISQHIDRNEIGRYIASVCLSFFYELDQHLLFSIQVERSSFPNMIWKYLHIDGPSIFNIQMLILSWPCAFP